MLFNGNTYPSRIFNNIIVTDPSEQYILFHQQIFVLSNISLNSKNGNQ